MFALRRGFSLQEVFLCSPTAAIPKSRKQKKSSYTFIFLRHLSKYMHTSGCKHCHFWPTDLTTWAKAQRQMDGSRWEHNQDQRRWLWGGSPSEAPAAQGRLHHWHQDTPIHPSSFSWDAHIPRAPPAVLQGTLLHWVLEVIPSSSPDPEGIHVHQG